jgi:endonuclease NucS-like protein
MSMAIRTAVWKVSAKPEPLLEVSLAKEQFLEEMIVAEPKILSDEFMLIGRQEDTGFGGRIDLLALAPDGSLILIELKRNRTPREVVAQALDYASWVQKLTLEQILEIYWRFAPSKVLADDFRQRFGVQLADENLNNSHQISIVASELDDSSERIVAYPCLGLRIPKTQSCVNQQKCLDGFPPRIVSVAKSISESEQPPPAICPRICA